jgi:hypothetical protein
MRRECVRGRLKGDWQLSTLNPLNFSLGCILRDVRSPYTMDRDTKTAFTRYFLERHLSGSRQSLNPILSWKSRRGRTSRRV